MWGLGGVDLNHFSYMGGGGRKDFRGLGGGGGLGVR